MNAAISPALLSRSELYPAAWRGRVPKRIRMMKTVRSDFPCISRLIAPKGGEYNAWVNSHGAVAAVLPIGEMLGVRPYEFEVIEWHPEASGGVQ